MPKRSRSLPLPITEGESHPNMRTAHERNRKRQVPRLDRRGAIAASKATTARRAVEAAPPAMRRQTMRAVSLAGTLRRMTQGAQTPKDAAQIAKSATAKRASAMESAATTVT